MLKVDPLWKTYLAEGEHIPALRGLASASKRGVLNSAGTYRLREERRSSIVAGLEYRTEPESSRFGVRYHTMGARKACETSKSCTERS